MMEQKYILDLGKLLIIALDLKRYLTKETHMDAIVMDLHMW